MTDSPTNMESAAGTEARMPSAGGSAAGTTAAAADAGNDSPAPAGRGGAAGTGGAAGKASMGSGNAGSGTAKPEMLDPSVDWTALELEYPTMYSSYDGVHMFQVPVKVAGAQAVELSGWSAIPSDAVQIDPNAEGGGVLVTIRKYVPEITVAARSGMIGGTAKILVTEATPEEWATGEHRYTTGEDWQIIPDEELPPELQGMDVLSLTPEQLMMLLGPEKYNAFAAELLVSLPARLANPPLPPTNLKCTNCHTSGAKYIEVQHTPTQMAQVSDEELTTIFTQGKKPDRLGFRVLRVDLQPLYVMMHKWDTTEAEVKGLIVYLRSLAPKGQGDVKGVDGKYRPPMPEGSFSDLITCILLPMTPGC